MWEGLRFETVALPGLLSYLFVVIVSFPGHFSYLFLFTSFVIVSLWMYILVIVFLFWTAVLLFFEETLSVWLSAFSVLIVVPLLYALCASFFLFDVLDRC